MDFGTLLHVAKKNSENKKNEGKFYNTKFAPPKKETKEKKLSDNIQKFLQKREQEERERQRMEREKLASLLAMRDDKSKNKIRKMLKVTKSANKSVLDDAVNSEHTAVTMQGPEQPDQDDYGYVSTEANAFYQKYIDKVKDVKEDKGFAPSRPQSLKDLSGTKERVKAAITKESEEKKSHTRQRSSVPTSTVVAATDSSSNISRASTTSKTLYDPEAERRDEERKKREEDQKKLKNRKPLPPPMDFQALLKLAEKKQHEPIEILPEAKRKKEPERLLTSKEKRELEERQREKEMRERRKQERNLESQKDRKETSGSTLVRMEPNGRIPKLNQSMKINANTTASKHEVAISSLKSNSTPSNILKKSHTSASSSSTPITKPSKIPPISHAKSASSSSSAKQGSSSIAVKSSVPYSKPTTSLNALSSSKNPHGDSVNKNPYSGPTREFPPRDTKSIKSKQFPPPDIQRARPVQQADMRRGLNNRLGDSRKPQPPKRRILDDDEDEYDSELDDFIDDGDCEEDYSAHIKAIFGYDKSRYRYADEDDDAAMESNFAQVQREEYISKKIGLQEDLEDMKMEAIEKKRKMLSKKRKISD